MATKIELQERECPSCGGKFRVMPTSNQKMCSLFCVSKDPGIPERGWVMAAIRKRKAQDERASRLNEK